MNEDLLFTRNFYYYCNMTLTARNGTTTTAVCVWYLEACMLEVKSVNESPESLADRVWVKPGLARTSNSPPVNLHLAHTITRGIFYMAKLKTMKTAAK